MPSSAARSVNVVQYSWALSVTPTRTVTRLSASAVAVAPAELSPPPDAQAASDAVGAIAAIQAVSLRFMGVCLSGGPGGGRAGSGVLRGRGWCGVRAGLAAG